MKTFETYTDVISDPYFQERVRVNYNILIHNRCFRPEPKPGFYYKRDWYDRMKDQNLLSVTVFINQIEKIWNRTHELSSEIRRVIEYVCNEALRETLLYYAKMNSAELNQNNEKTS